MAAETEVTFSINHQKKKIEGLNLVCQRLLSNNESVQLPQKSEESLQTLIDDINSSLARNKPELVLDRFHTFSTKLLRQICEYNGIVVKNDKGEFYPLHRSFSIQIYSHGDTN
jgi:ATP-dependent helicase/DNAse subunit B